jgi:hypothetical protein
MIQSKRRQTTALILRIIVIDTHEKATTRAATDDEMKQTIPRALLAVSSTVSSKQQPLVAKQIVQPFNEQRDGVAPEASAQRWTAARLLLPTTSTRRMCVVEDAQQQPPASIWA